MPKGRVCTQTDFVLSVVTTLATAHRFGQNGTSNNRGSKNRDCSLLFLVRWN